MRTEVRMLLPRSRGVPSVGSLLAILSLVSSFYAAHALGQAENNLYQWTMPNGKSIEASDKALLDAQIEAFRTANSEALTKVTPTAGFVETVLTITKESLGPLKQNEFTFSREGASAFALAIQYGAGVLEYERTVVYKNMPEEQTNTAFKSKLGTTIFEAKVLVVSVIAESKSQPNPKREISLQAVYDFFKSFCPLWPFC